MIRDMFYVALLLVLTWEVKTPTSSFNPISQHSSSRSSVEEDATHVMIGENALINRPYLDRHTRQSHVDDGDSWAVADLWYDATHRRVHARSLQLADIDDPADLKMGRAPGTYPNEINRSRVVHAPGTVVGQIGFANWDYSGLTAYQGAAQGVVITERKMGYCIATAYGESARTRSGSPVEYDELVCQVMVMPDGTVIIGYNADPTKPLRLIVRGDLEVEGRIIQR